MQISKFGGTEAEEWTTFSASFKTVIHDNTKFSDTQKLMYLRSCLTGKALNKIESLEITNENYKVAWDTLENDYFDFPTIMNKRVKSFFDLPLCTKPCASALGNLLDEAFKNYKALEALNKPYLHAFPIFTITSKLDNQTRIKWLEYSVDKDNPTMDDLLTFLQERKRVLQKSQVDKDGGS